MFTHATVYFSFGILCEKDLKELVERMSFEWSRVDVQKLMINDLPSFSTETFIAMYHLHNNGHIKTLTSKLTTILTQARDINTKKDLGEPYDCLVPLAS